MPKNSRKVFSNKRSRSKLQIRRNPTLEVTFVLDAFEALKIVTDVRDPQQKLLLERARKIVNRAKRRGKVPIQEMQNLESIAVTIQELRCSGKS